MPNPVPNRIAELHNGVYIDCLNHQISMFEGGEIDLTACRDVIQSRWPGWPIEIHHEGLPGQWLRSGRDPASVMLGEDLVLQQIIQLWQYSAHYNPERVLHLLREQGVEFARILPDLLKSDPPDPSQDRAAMLARTIAEYCRNRPTSTETTA